MSFEKNKSNLMKVANYYSWQYHVANYKKIIIALNGCYLDWLLAFKKIHLLFAT